MKKRISFTISLTLILVLVLSMTSGYAQDTEIATEYKMDIQLDDDAKALTGTQTVSFTNNYGVELDELVFHLYADSYGSFETLPSIGGSYDMSENQKLPIERLGDIDIKNVTTKDEDVDFTQDNQILKVNLPKALKHKEKIEVTISFELKIPLGTHRLGYFENVISLTNWYPILSVYDSHTKTWDENPYHPIGESNYSEASDYIVNILVPNDMKVVATGTITDETLGKDSKLVKIKAGRVRDHVIMMSRDYNVVTREVDGIKINSYYLDNKTEEKQKSAEILLEEVANTVEFFNEVIGKYPYDELDITETYLSGGAMEYPQLIQMGSYGNINEDYKSSTHVPFLIEAAVHEAIHQWWYVGVGNNENKEPILDESLTVFTTAYYFEKNYGEYHQNATLMQFRSRIYPEEHLSFTSSVDKFNGWGDYGYVIYNKAPIVFEDLRKQIGEEKFIEILRKYYDKFLYKNASVEGLLEVIEEVAGKEIKEYFNDAINDSRYFPEHIQLTVEENQVIRKEQMKSQLIEQEKFSGMTVGSIILKGIEGEPIYIVKPSNATELESMNMEYTIENLKFSLEQDLGLELVIKADNDVTAEEIKNNNLILIGNSSNNSVLEKYNNDFPISINSEVIELDDLIIKNKNTSGMFISNHIENDEKLILVLFWSEENENPQMGRFSVWDSYMKYFINIDGRVDIRGN